MRLRNNPQAKIFLENNYQIVIQEPHTYQGNWASKIFFNFVENSWYLLNILNFRYILIW
ncbi:hypothetical protein [Spiroplasma endosymbiont of Clivina fossor]|uniref:hypothetical protein n=1 Tax=Spiroplasma endosymbiont of Clivina fossor TaxID=3066282 RepID=UPI00313E12D5